MGTRLGLMMMDERETKYRHLWDGSESWGLYESHWNEVQVKVQFVGDAASQAEIKTLRELSPDLRDQPLHQLVKSLTGRREFDFGTLPSPAARALAEKATQLGLHVLTIDKSRTEYLPVELTHKSALIIEDDETARWVTAKMLGAGVPVVGHIEAD